MNRPEHRGSGTAVQPGGACDVIWLGPESPLLKELWQQSHIYHVSDSAAAVRAVERALARCVVLDLHSQPADLVPLSQALRRANPAVGVLALVDEPVEPARIALSGALDVLLSRSSSAAELHAALMALDQDVAQRNGTPRPTQPDQPPLHELQSRMRQLEGLVQVALNLPDTFEESTILGDLPHVARVAVDADRIAVLLADANYTTLSDALGLGVPEAYLRVCREQFARFSRDERLMYLGDEVLLRERLPDMLRSAMRVREAEAAGAWSYMRLPLMIDEQLIGFVALFSDTPGRFNGAHLQLGRLFAAQVSTAVRNMRLAFRLKRAEQRQQAVAQVARLIAEDLALDAVLTRIVEEAVRLVQGRLGTVLLVQADGSLMISAVSGADKKTIGTRIESGRGQAGVVALTAQPSVITDFANWEPLNPAISQPPEQGEMLLAVPLIYRGRVLGVLQVLAPRATLDDVQEQQDVLMMLAPQAAIAIAKAQLHEKVRQDQQQLRAILEHTAAAIAVYDAQGKLLIANPEARRVFERIGIDVAACTERPFLDVVKERFGDALPDLPRPDSLLELNLGDAGEYLLHIAPVRRPNGAVDRYVCVGQDVSQIRRIERLKTDMIHILSHDLRNPLGLARGSLELLNEPDVPADQHAQLMSMVVTSLERMDQLIQDVVDLEQAESPGAQSAAPYDLPALVEKVVKRNRNKAESQNVELVYTELSRPPGQMRGHAVMVGQAIDNLLSNAIKYTPTGGRVEISLAVEDEHAVIRVKDTGYGIPKESLPHLFRQFYRVHDRRTRHIQGTGLGLSLVKAIAHAHGGRVTVESEIDVGSVFTLMLPLNATPEKDGGAQSPLTRVDLSTLIKLPDGTSPASAAPAPDGSTS